KRYFRMKKLFCYSIFFILYFVVWSYSGEAARIKDIVSISGVRDNQLIGYGLVVGLRNTGDNYFNSQFTIQTLLSMLEKLGTTVDVRQLFDVRIQNVAAVMVTANLPPFARIGGRIDVTVSSLGDARSLEGGTLLITPLKAPNGEIYAVAQGAVSGGGAFLIEAERATVRRGHATVGKIAGGAIIEREISFDFNKKEGLSLILHRPDFTTALNIANAINTSLGETLAFPLDSGTISLKIPEKFRVKLVEMMGQVESLDVNVDNRAKVVLDERTGTVAIGENVRLSSAAISHGELTVEIKEQLRVIQPPPFTLGQPLVIPESAITVKERAEKVMLVPATVNIGDLVKALNAVGASTRDLIAIFQSLKAVGALQAELEML
ncbi:MAG: flagellar basal body P-ring protein FlgI, partial [Nitrospinota bacterium]